MTDLSISTLQTKDLAEASCVVAKGFLTEPADHIKAVWKGSAERVFEQHKRLFSLLFQVKGKEVYVVKLRNQIVAVYALQHSSFRHMSLMQQAKILLPMIRAVGRNLPRLIHWQNQWGSVEPDGDYLHLSPMCVLPEAQGLGIGKLMLKHFCDILDERGLVGYLETGKWENVLFYQKFGFSVQDEIDIYGAHTWTMKRIALK